MLTRAALTVANSARDILIAQEGAFGTHLLAHDVIDPPLMFGAESSIPALALDGAPGFDWYRHARSTERGSSACLR